MGRATMSRKKTPDSSLELLLDTICNTFGGVLFLAILICVLLRMTTRLEAPVPVADAASPEELAALQVKLDELVAELDALRLSASQQRAVRAATRPEKEQAFKELQRERDQRDALFKERLEAIGRIEAARSNAQRVRRGLDQLLARHAKAKQNVASATSDLEKAKAEGVRLASAVDELVKAIRASEAQTAPLPRRRFTIKREIGVVVRFDRLYVWHRYGRFGERLGLNDDEFVVVGDDGSELLTMPKPYAGVALSDDAAAQSIVSRLKDFDPDNHYFAIAIWGDSFDTFQILKSALVGLKFEYRLMPVEEGKGVVDRGGRGGKVQ